MSVSSSNVFAISVLPFSDYTTVFVPFPQNFWLFVQKPPEARNLPRIRLDFRRLHEQVFLRYAALIFYKPVHAGAKPFSRSHSTAFFIVEKS